MIYYISNFSFFGALVVWYVEDTLHTQHKNIMCLTVDFEVLNIFPIVYYYFVLYFFGNELY